MITYTKESAEKIFDDFLTALEIDKESINKETDIDESSFNQYKDTKEAVVSALMLGRLTIDLESISINYTFRKPLSSGDVSLTDITLSVENASIGNTKKVQSSVSKDNFAAVKLFSSQAVGDNILNKMGTKEATLLVLVANLFLSY